ncbi:hypothetical protein BDV32DRAFT_64331 [Aspergillus pseudonomiae]|uniref:Uncharacterized protein n=1 Tax=Aspergillus pseudonomiae TaxID=1506151 RepID=A0A5N7DNC1_9EURO|nr:uncharacterized protein BDV37DRAFT_205498 [Aspergillus pseudonomiae]KAB8258989.1 hypothetical protein BDV32DRAFT_64331 [Aspergillus pseudonomiae]KAE8407942.1 hypothetical protein BDV37DRAFT_205498 [Aspergillus pseudonomiae]
MSNKRRFDEAALEGYDDELLMPNAGDTVDDALLFENIQLSPPNPELVEQTISQQVETAEIPSATAVPEEISTTRPPLEDRDAPITTALEATDPSRAVLEATQELEDATAHQNARKPPKKKARKNHEPTQNRGKLDWRDAYLTNHHKRKNKMMAEWVAAKEKHEKALKEEYPKEKYPNGAPDDKQFKKREPLTRAPTACDYCRLFKSRCNSDKDTECSNCIKTNSWCGETNASTHVTHYRGWSRDQDERIQTQDEELDGLKRREQNYRNKIEELEKQLDDWKTWATKVAWLKHGIKPPAVLLPNIPARNTSRANYSWGKFSSLPTFPTYTSWPSLVGTEHRRDYSGKGTAQVPAARSLGLNQLNHPGLDTVASGPSQTAPSYHPQQNGEGLGSLTNYPQIGRLQPDTLHQDTAVNSYRERFHQPLDGQMDGMPHGLPTPQYSVFNPPLGQGLPPLQTFPSQYPAPLQIQQLHNNQIGYYTSPAQVIAQGAHPVKPDSSYVYDNPQTEDAPSLQQSAEDNELYEE